MFNNTPDELYSYQIDPCELPIQLTMQTQQAKVNENIQEMYYEQYKKIYQTAFKLQTEGNKQRQLLRCLNKQIMHIESQLNAFTKRKRMEQSEEICQSPSENGEKKLIRRNRRTAEKITRQFVCPYQRCDKSYGSDGSLQQHFKLKHPQHMQKQQCLQNKNI